MYKERYRNSSDTLTLCSILFSISPHAYKYLRDYGRLILPHPETINGSCNKFLTDLLIDERKSFLTYARNMFPFLKDEGKNVTLLFDEIHIQRYLDYKAANTAGIAIIENAKENNFGYINNKGI